MEVNIGIASAAVVCVDWGSTNFRLWALDKSGRVVAERRKELGAATLGPAEYENVLETVLTELHIGPAVPAIICGMAGAVNGWYETPYIPLPARLAELPANAVRIPTARRDIRILPGLAQRPNAPPAGAAEVDYDVMRGEETILFGAMREKSIRGAPGRTICLPGTHCKWVQLDAAKSTNATVTPTVTRFCTAMTGELFAWLATHSTLASFVETNRADLADTDAFAAAVKESLSAPARAFGALFSIRARALLATGADAHAKVQSRAYLSGLLIGLEIAGMQSAFAGSVALIADDDLAENYRRALHLAGVEFACHSARELARRGLWLVARELWNDAFE